MMKRQISSLLVLPVMIAALIFIPLSMPTVLSADAPAPTPVQGNCVGCHENLYFLHDTGNWYCLRQSPMSCVDCHGGNPAATTREDAHISRAAHPVVNDDISRCQQCHPAECTERMRIFDQNAGISEVLVAMPYTPRTEPGLEPAISTHQPEERGVLTDFPELLPILLLLGGAAIVYFIHTHRLSPR